MISYIKGTIAAVGENFAVIENNGIGYMITMPGSSLYAIGNMDGEVKVLTYMAVKEDDVSLYGFLTTSELEMFRMLITVSGVGPKGAIGILSSITADELKMAIAAEDSKLIASAKGIGSKTAQKIVVELKGKVGKEVLISDSLKAPSPGDAFAGRKSAVHEAIDALEALGFSRSSAVKAINQLEEIDDLTASDIIGRALKIIE